MAVIGAVVTALTSNPAPVLYLDSCILLDIVRAPRRNKSSEVWAAQVFLTAVGKTSKTIHLLIGTPTPREWSDHIGETVDDCTGAIDSCNAVSAICGYLALPTVAPLPTGVFGLPGMLRQLSSDLLAAAVLISHDAAALSRAVDRVIASVIPAKPGGKGAKDAVILEHAVETTARLRAAAFTQPCIFVSSNTKDFAASGSTNLHPQLAPTFTTIQLEYATSLTHAETILTNGGWSP
jgi:hypothetical protein